METKLCRRCSSVKLHSEFNKNKTARDGLQKYCRDCTRKFSRQNKERKAANEGRIMKPYKEMKFAQITEEELLAYLRTFTEKNGRPPTTEDLENNPDYPCAYTYYRRFNYKTDANNKSENWNAILARAGIDVLNYFSLWRAWEYLVECCVQVFENDYLFQYTGLTDEYIPDIVIPSKKLIIDALTSNYSTKHKRNQYKNAKKFGYDIEFWCLYRTTENGINEEDVTYVFADEIIKRLEPYGQTALIEKIQTILQNHEQYTKEKRAHKQEYLKAKLLEYANLVGRTPTSRDFANNRDFPATTTFATYFGTFTKALEYAGLESNQSRPSSQAKVAAEELIALANKLKRPPTPLELGPPHTTYSIFTYEKYWGSVESCLKEYGYFEDKIFEKPIIYFTERNQTKMKTINWTELDELLTILVKDEQLNIQLTMQILDITDEKVILESLDFVYSMQIYKEDWEDGNFSFFRRAV